MMKNRFLLGILSVCTALLMGCTSPENWVFKEEFALQDISPIGILLQDQYLWLSDAENNRVLKTDLKGKILEEYKGLQRPMHMAIWDSNVYVPEFISDTIKVIGKEGIEILTLGESPDAPGGVAVSGETIAVADFYNHRILLQTGGSTQIFGGEGHNAGELYYPTDVEIYEDNIYVADAYNNRIQVFDKQGHHLKVIGDKDGINVATGIGVANKTLFVADFEGNRVLLYDLKGFLKQELKGHFNKPVDVYTHENQLFVANYGASNIIVFEKN